jgi:ABC-type antimicrobial peptide transport system permease subunit
MVGVGLMLGIGGAVLAGRALQNYLYQTPSVSPVVYATVAGLFVVAGLVACWGPARRATSIDPLRALRAD